ncbi:MAG TPA: hypothetical protein ENL04_02260, partial [Sulfuricurvum sp.]|nr:hypothetical protein [Sulfuricurvum sp.]
MRHFLLSIILLSSTLFAETTLQFQKGWQLVGTPQAISDLSVFNDHTTIIWAYDAVSKQWQGYAHDADTAAKLSKAGIIPLSQLDTFDAF